MIFAILVINMLVMVIESTPNFEFQSELYLKEPASTN